MSISLFIIGILVGGIATLVAVILTIISLATGKNKNAALWAVGFVFSLTILLLSLFQFAKRVGAKVKSGVEWLEENKDNGLLSGKSKEDLIYQEQERQYFIDSLTKYTKETVLAQMPPDFYSNKPVEKSVDSKIIVPFVYPLSIRYRPNEFIGEIINSVTDSVFLKNISQLAFDENFVIAKVDNVNDKELMKSGRGEIEYILFDLRTREYLIFSSQKQLLDKSSKIGYIGSTEMRFLSDIYRGWLDPLNFDY